MSKAVLQLLRSATLLGLMFLVQACRSERTRLNPREPKEDISRQVLDGTPLGSTPADVLAFIKKFKHPGGEPKYDRRNHTIAITLGRWGLNGETYIFWLFDPHDRALIDVSVAKERDAL